MELPLPGEEGYEDSGLGSADQPRVREQEPRVRDREEQRTLADGQAGRTESRDTNRESDAEEPSPWRTALPGLRDMWQKHKEKWPENERPPADRSHDEPGSWRSDNGHYLNAEENLASEHTKARIGEVEEKMTAILHDIKAEILGADLVGLESRFKGDGRFKEKVSEELRAKPERSIAEISERMPDALRYTYQFETAGYVGSYWRARGMLESRGNELLLSRNTWDDLDYKGINTRWLSPDGQTFEVQFHTQESYEAKQLTHKAYERLRSRTTSPAERPALESFQRQACACISIPEGVSTIPDYRKEGY